MKVALAQLSMKDDMNQNAANAIDTMDRAAESGADLIFFPEIQFSPFFPQYTDKDVLKYMMNIEHQYVKKIQKKCIEHQLICSPNFYLREKEKSFDASLMIDSNGDILGISKMVHIAQFPCFYEQDYYAPSDSGFKVYDTAFGKIGVVICFDRHLPESIRTCALKGAKLIIIPTANAKGEPLEMFEWEIRVQARHNSVFIAMCNRVGVEGEMEFCGESIVVDPNGEVIAKADEQEQILYADIDLDMVDKVQKDRPFEALRRPELYL